jgi:hypothetical protein
LHFLNTKDAKIAKKTRESIVNAVLCFLRFLRVEFLIWTHPQGDSLTPMWGHTQAAATGFSRRQPRFKSGLGRHKKQGVSLLEVDPLLVQGLSLTTGRMSRLNNVWHKPPSGHGRLDLDDQMDGLLAVFS